jgi:hypothetical protein
MHSPCLIPTKRIHYFRIPTRRKRTRSFRFTRMMTKTKNRSIIRTSRIRTILIKTIWINYRFYHHFHDYIICEILNTTKGYRRDLHPQHPLYRSGALLLSYGSMFYKTNSLAWTRTRKNTFRVCHVANYITRLNY